MLSRRRCAEEKIEDGTHGINLDTVQLLASNYGFHYSQVLMKKAAEVLSRLCADNRMLFHVRENRFAFYIYDYKDKNELLDFSNTLVKTLRSLFVTERIGGGIGILEIGHDDDDVELLMRRLLISPKKCRLIRRGLRSVYDEELEAIVDRERISLKLSMP